MSRHVVNRNRILDALRQELVGPSPQGTEIDNVSDICFDRLEDAYGPWKQKETGEEILQRDPPTKRYGIGVLYPWEVKVDDTADIEDAGVAAIGLHSREEEVIDPKEEVLTKTAADEIRDIEEGIGTDNSYDDDLSDLDLSASNVYRPSSMGISFLTELPLDAKFVIEASLGRYERVPVKVGEYTHHWWLRKPIRIVKEFQAEDICSRDIVKLDHKVEQGENCGPIDLRVELYARPNPHKSNNRREKLITVCLVNRSVRHGDHYDELCVFQTSFHVKILSSSQINCICPYPETTREQWDEEEKSLALLYQNFQTYAVGHGCAANWGEKDGTGKVDSVMAESLPAFETPSITPDIEDEHGKPIKVEMASLAGLDPEQDGFDELERVIDAYEEWIAAKRRVINSLPAYLHNTASMHLERCASCASRMRKGLKYLKEVPLAFRAFQLANRAILLQQLIQKEPRMASYDEKANRWRFSDPYVVPNPSTVKSGIGQWRAFQIAFLLMSLRSTIESEDRNHETVELIWFPTGGGKTEAYLGLAAFALFMRRLKDPKDVGVHVITRYTLRLLTAQQFQRASRLICAMEHIRRENPDLGTVPFSIGIWVGSSNTPNTRKQALSSLSLLQKGERYAENKFILGQCPWCGAQMGPIRTKVGRKWKTRIAGYSRRHNTVVYRCPDNECSFNKHLPIYTIDEDIYQFRPSVVIGTVDKFAMLAWRPEARSLFGIDERGNRQYSPPGLVIQDELHLISGPLGSVVGLYETVIEELCTDRRSDKPIPPKIVSSTATIRRYAEQVKALYGRESVELFPPPGLDADDSFFARYAKDAGGNLLHGRLYVGVHGPGLGSLQTVQVRTFSALMQAPTSISYPELQDPWWTLLIFFNSLRELGTTLSLFQSDIPDYLKVTANRLGIPYGKMRKLWHIRELTGRLQSDKVPQAIRDLEVSCDNSSDKRPVDACLASNILEVGVDIDRLSLMAVVGQPKSTSQYIQVTGRVGRRWWERPGLVATIYTASKPRDRSHFEKFRSYHERLYAQVEPVSVTPFSPPVLDRALHAIMVMYARQSGPQSVAASPYPYPGDIIEDLRDILLPRIEIVDATEIEHFKKVFEKRASEWEQWERTTWRRKSVNDSFLLRSAGEYVDEENRLYSWSTPTSMRNVDAECRAQITNLYLQEKTKEV